MKKYDPLLEAAQIIRDETTGWSTEYKLSMAKRLADHLYPEKETKWEKPEWMLPGWIAMDADGSWNWYEKKPKKCKDFWDCWFTIVELTDILGKPLAANFKPPDIKDWKKSLIRV